MNTPRDLLRARHQAIEPKLDQIRRNAVAELTPRPTLEPNLAIAPILKLWRELIWPARRVWAGFAAAWLMILLVNLGDYDRGELVGAPAVPSSMEVQMARDEQNRMLSELLESTWIDPAEAAEPAPPPRRNPQPRSERRPLWLIG